MAVPYNLPKSQETITIEQFLGTLFQFRDKIHLAHLHTNSFAAHKALGEVYEGLLDIIDTLVESAQTDALLNIVIPSSSTSDSNENSVQELLNYVRLNRHVFPHSFQQNEIDTIELLLSSGAYKLKFLK